MLSDFQLAEIRNKIMNEGIRLMVAVQGTAPDFEINPINMSKVRKQLFEAYPETEKVATKLRLENRLKELQKKFEEFKDSPDIAIEIELLISAIQRELRINY